MLSEFEARLVAAVGDLLAGRAGLSVVQAGGAPAALGASAGRLSIRVVAATPDAGRGFAPADRLPPAGDPPAITRVVPLGVEVELAFTRRAAGAGDAELRAARRVLLEDVTLALHALDAPAVRAGATLTPGTPDPGFAVSELVLAALAVAAAPAGDVQSAAAPYAGRLLVWPPGQAGEVGLVDAVDALVEALPLQLAAAPAVVAAGGTATVRIRGVAGSRPPDGGGAPEPVRLAVGVASALPPADRGTVAGGTPAAVAGFRVLPAGSPETTVTYTAPAGPLGTVRSEEVVVHLATTGGGVGIRLGSVAVGLRAGP